MTARVFNPVALTEFSKLRSPSISRAMSCGSQLNRIKRDLFGPVNPAETTKIFTDELEKQQEKATKKWGFDFRTGSPLVTGNTQFIWERVSYTDFVPEMYTLSRAAHVRELPEVTALDLLMDERADRENLSSSNADDDSCDDSQDESMVLFKAPAASAAPSAMASSRTLRKRQPKITEYMKERKRLAQTPKKISPSKRARTTSGSSSSSLLNSLRNLQRNH